MKLDYRAQRPDGTTISGLRSLIFNEDETIRDLERRIVLCRDTRNDFISRLSQEERVQLVSDNPTIFTQNLPSVEEVAYLYEGAES